MKNKAKKKNQINKTWKRTKNERSYRAVGRTQNDVRTIEWKKSVNVSRSVLRKKKKLRITFKAMNKAHISRDKGDKQSSLTKTCKSKIMKKSAYQIKNRIKLIYECLYTRTFTLTCKMNSDFLLKPGLDHIRLFIVICFLWS